MTQSPIRVLIIADDPLARTGLTALLEDHSEIAIVGSLNPEEMASGMMDVFRPDVLLWDVGWETEPSDSTERRKGFEWLDNLEYEIPILALLSDETQAFDAWTAGAQGLLSRDTDETELIAALQAVVNGLNVLKHEFTTRLIPSAAGLEASPIETLTDREMEVLQLLAEGLPNKTIALHLNVSEHTIKFHVNSILRKLGAQSRTDAVVRASRLGLILL
ncbi:MAG: DNA-binding response regulator [Anaerolineales bacterium]|nr:DNA-binding response regulator [Anaerolineales bacterium]